MRISLFAATASAALGLVGVFVSDSVADHPQLDYPAAYDVRERIVINGTITGNGIERHMTQRGNGQDVIVFDDDSNLHFEPNVDAPEIHATWQWTRHRRATFRMDAAAVAYLEQSIEDVAGMNVSLRVRPGKLTFRRDHESFAGFQVIRAVSSYRGYRIVLTERIRYTGTPRPPVESMTDASATHALSAVAERMRTAAGSLPGR